MHHPPHSQPELPAHYLSRAYDLARARTGYTSPNPPVGAVVVRDGQILGEGAHQQAGHPHAEVMALRACGDISLVGATLYVTLEPCSTTGRTPPCTELIIASGISSVVVGCPDPNPKHAGRGFAILEAAGIEVILAEPAQQLACQLLIAPFVKRTCRSLPFVTLKLAMTLDGKIADATGGSRWITGPAAREVVQDMRLHTDGVMVGSGTYYADHPSLLPHVDNPPAKRRFVVSRKSLTDLRPGFEPLDGTDLRQSLTHLAEQGLCHLLCEGGGALAAALLEQGLVDECLLFYAPKLLADPHAKAGFTSAQGRSIDQALLGKLIDTQLIGDDVLIHFIPHSSSITPLLTN